MHGSTILSSIISGLYFVTFIVCMIFGPAKGQTKRKTNAHYVFLYLLIMAGLSLADSLTPWQYNIHIDMFRIVKSFFLIYSLSVVLTNIINGVSLYMHLHIQNIILTTIFLFLSLDASNRSNRIVWLVIYAVASVIRLFYLLRESLHMFKFNPTFTKYLAMYIILYDIVYFVATIISPYFQGLISTETYKFVMDITDAVVTILCTFPIVHYGWSTVRHERALIKEGQISRAYQDGTLSTEAIWDMSHCYLWSNN